MYKCALIGHEIQYSLSPLIHEIAANLQGIRLVYSLIDVHPSAFDWKFQELLTGDYQLFNITRPYKYKAARSLDGKLRSINTVYKQSGRWNVASTDGSGFYLAMKYEGVDILTFKNIYILGSGAVTYSLCDDLFEKGYKGQIHIFSRSHPLFQIQNVKYHELSIYEILDKMQYSNEYLVIQASSAMSHGDDLNRLLPAFENFEGVFVDLSYGNKVSAIFRMLHQSGKECYDGLSMLVMQAILSQEIAFGVKHDFVSVYKEIQKKLSII